MRYNKILGVLFLGVIIGACSPSVEDAFNQADSTVKDVFLSTEAKEPNYSFDSFNVYKPDELEVLDESEHNVVFTDGDQPFVLFVNELEAPNSRWFYDRIEDEGVHLRTFQTDEAFSYLHALEHDEDYEVHLGIGGIKMSTVSSLNEIEGDIEMMIEIINSVKEKEEEE
ncbi:hypothetical protein [Alkalibacillus silvisoli]|uniref:Uncharacterized protein n=1 Tax=Alkalibacillus silvisoli TaxID=392823 RepID=A0ABN0ZQP8_9BACI